MSVWGSNRLQAAPSIDPLSHAKGCGLRASFASPPISSHLLSFPPTFPTFQYTHNVDIRRSHLVCHNVPVMLTIGHPTSISVIPNPCLESSPEARYGAAPARPADAAVVWQQAQSRWWS
jgi:hypothetical protein